MIWNWWKEATKSNLPSKERTSCIRIYTQKFVECHHMVMSQGNCNWCERKENSKGGGIHKSFKTYEGT